MVETAVETRMEALRRRLLKAVKVDGIVTYKDLSLALGQNPTFVQQFVTKRSPKRLYDEQVETIDRILNERERQAPIKERPSIQPGQDETLQKTVDRLMGYPSAVQERVISFAEFEMARYDQSREKET